MKKLILAAALLLLPAFASAQTITCAVTGATAKQATLYASFLAGINAERAAQAPPLPPLLNFSDHCGFVMLSAFQSYVAQQARVDAEKVTTAVETKGDEVALTAHCTAAGLSAGCLKVQVACFVLTGNVACN